MRSILLACSLLVCVPVAAQVVHRCVDALGNVSYSDRGCPGADASTVVVVPPHVPDQSGVPSAMENFRQLERQRERWRLEGEQVKQQNQITGTRHKPGQNLRDSPECISAREAHEWQAGLEN